MLVDASRLKGEGKKNGKIDGKLTERTDTIEVRGRGRRARRDQKGPNRTGERIKIRHTLSPRAWNKIQEGHGLAIYERAEVTGS